MRPFRPAPGLRHAVAQSVWPRFTRSFVRVRVEHEVWDTPDGDVLDMDRLPHVDGAPGVLVIHGLEASSRTPYVRGMMAMLRARGWNGAALNYRSCGPTPHRNPRLYHAGFTDDVDLAVRRLREEWNDGPLGVIGYSLGANMLINWLGERGEAAPVEAAVAISPPYDLTRVADVVDAPGWVGAFWRRRFLRSLKTKALRLAEQFPDTVDAHAIRHAHTFREFDEVFTAPLFGFDSARDYWEKAACKRYLPGVRRPTLLISADDDPLIPGSLIPVEAIEANASVELWRTPFGGHVGFVGGSALRPVYAADEAALEYLAARLTTSPHPPSAQPTAEARSSDR